MGPWLQKVLTFPTFGHFAAHSGTSLIDASSIEKAGQRLECQSFEWYLQRFSYIYAGVPSISFNLPPPPLRYPSPPLRSPSVLLRCPS